MFTYVDTEIIAGIYHANANTQTVLLHLNLVNIRDI